MKYPLFIIPILLLFLSSCFYIPAPAPLPEDTSLRHIKIPLEFNEVTIVDKRTSKIAFEQISMLKVATYNPPISESISNYIKQKIKSSSDVNGYITNAEFRLTRGDAKLSKEFQSLEEAANVDLEIFVEIPEMGMHYTSSASLDYTWPSLNPNREHLEILYNLAIKNAMQVALEQLSQGITDQLNK